MKLLAYRDVEWTEELDKAIGTESDSIIGHRFGISPRSITVRRQQLGKMVFRASPTDLKWSKSMDRQLGTLPDTELAKRLNIDVYWIRHRRQELGVATHVIPKAPKSTKKKNILHLTPGRIASLGKSSDTFLAKRWGVGPASVARARHKLGIEPHTENREIDWTKTLLGMLGEVPDGTVAREYGLSAFCVKIKRIQMGILPFGKSEMDPEPELPQELIDELGNVPDKHLSDQYGVSRSKIRLYRTLHAISLAEYTPPTEHSWSEVELALLGTMSDGAVARKIGIPAVQVCHHRRKLGIAPFDRKGKVRWTQERISELGKNPDHDLARRWKIQQRDVTAKRESLNIAACVRKTRHWPKSELKILGTMPDTVIAKQLGVSEGQVAGKRAEHNIPPFKSSAPYEWSSESLEQLGKLPDEELALDLGLSYQFIAQKRLELGRPVMRRSSLKWTREIISKLGVIPDPQIAKELGCSTGLILLKRNELGISAYSKPK